MKARGINHLWGRLLIEELVRSGVGYFVVSPGSRSAPLAVAVAENERCEKSVHFDERGAAFHALGYAKATGRPAAVICTSGTAAANYLPAVVEASYSSTPLILLTADRPPELRASGATQTIDQIKMFSDHVRWFVDLPAPTTEIAPEFLLTTVDQAVARSRSAIAGPVHVNCMYREPLAPLGPELDYSEYVKSLRRWLTSDRPYTEYSIGHSQDSATGFEALAGQVAGAKRGIIIAGYLPNCAEREAIIALADRLRWPLLADITSQLRSSGKSSASLIAHYDFTLRSEAIARRLRPDLILQFGGTLISNSANQFLTNSAADWIVVDAGHSRIDPVHRVTNRIIAGPAAVARSLTAGVKESPSQLLPAFQALDRLAAESLESLVADKAAGLHELTTVALVLKAATSAFLAASMPLRLADMAAAFGQRCLIGANRGVNGIDGTIASAAGFARGTELPTTLLIGDLALLHDLNSLSLLRCCPQPVIIVCLNNNGGGIFSHLPIAKLDEHFEEYFGTPHGLNFRPVAEMFEIKYHEPKTPKDLAAVYRAAMKSKKPALIEVKTRRAEELEWLRRFWSRIEENALRQLDEFVNS